ncbi:Copia-like polyprotein/retrotransposon, putative [Medicago truncatula]|uniref:Copia-like polyprotein/retrotransposon, putative n=1 Tax=Medicago truncatula TaxID=3880 RepID=A0A072TSF6_MEDTR|nr:Copia-like polyprotein/retrotransposon, putative [Medicago truncatula]
MCGKRNVEEDTQTRVVQKVVTRNGCSNIIALRERLDIHLKYLSLSIKYEKNNHIIKVPMSRNKTFLLNVQNDVAKYLKACHKRWVYAFKQK